ncbi:MAG TPA: hypothetical protein ENJ37_02040 [Deltaproteobacteria bacterium]|nr:hypothetical protein [Deltaproteobacteria bacterium]
MKRSLALTLALLIALSAAAPAAAGPATIEDEPSAEAIIFDMLLLRPVGVVSVVAGTAVFIISLPFALPSGSVKMAGKKLVYEPFIWTFQRPLGERGAEEEL